MRLVAIILILIAAVLLADMLFSGLLRPVIDSGAPATAGAPPSRFAGPAVMLVAGLLLLQKAGSPKRK